MTNYDDQHWGDEYAKSFMDIKHFAHHHLHYGWYPEIRLDEAQQGILAELTRDVSPLNLEAQETCLKWPMATYLLHMLVFIPGTRIAVVATTQREANRRYQGLLYPYDHMPDAFQRPFECRTNRELHLENGSYIKTFTQDTKKHIQDFNPNVLLLEDLGVTDARLFVKAKTRVIQLQRSV